MTLQARSVLGWRLIAALLALTISGAPTPVRAQIEANQRQSSSVLLSASNRAMQDDLSLHPASLWLQEGQAEWQRPAPNGGPSCQTCHGQTDAMKGVATRYPRRFSGVLMTLEDRINVCRTQNQQARAWPLEASPLLALSASVSLPSRGMPLKPDIGPGDADWQAGQDWFGRRLGQISLSCAHCHEQRWGRHLAGVTIPQGHPTGYPLYRLEWQNMGSLQRRMRNCMNAVRAEPFGPQAPEWRQLEAFLKWRARGMALETPALRP